MGGTRPIRRRDLPHTDWQQSDTVTIGRQTVGASTELETVNTVLPGVDATSMAPPCSSVTIRQAVSSPRPVARTLKLRGEERLEDARKVVFRDATAIVLDFDNIVSAFAPRAHRNRSTPVCRVDRVVEDVGPDLIERIAEDSHGGKVVIVDPLEGDVPHPVSQYDQRILQSLMEIDDLFGSPLHLGIPLDRAHEFGDTIAAPGDSRWWTHEPTAFRRANPVRPQALLLGSSARDATGCPPRDPPEPCRGATLRRHQHGRWAGGDLLRRCSEFRHAAGAGKRTIGEHVSLPCRENRTHPKKFRFDIRRRWKKSGAKVVWKSWC